MIDYNKIVSPHVLGLKPSGIRRFFDLAEEMEDVISLGVGEPDFQTPWHIRDAGIRSLELGKTRYTPNSGIKELRIEIVNYLSRRFSLEYDIAQTVVTVGGSEAIDLCVRTLVAPGEEVLIPEPSFVCYDPITVLAGGVPVAIPTYAKDDFRLTAEAVRSRITEKTKLLILPYPNNPTGAIMAKKDLEEIAALLRNTGIMILSDEIYAELTYGDAGHASIASLPGMAERTVIVGGFSKCYSMTGWRLGYAVGPEPVIGQMTKIHQYAIMSAPTTAQYAAVQALKNGDEDIRSMREEYDMRRRYIVDGFRHIGFDCFEPMGAFYCFPYIGGTGLSSAEFCERLIKEEKVAVVPGTAFGESGEGFVRVSYCYSSGHIKEALRRIERFKKNLR